MEEYQWLYLITSIYNWMSAFIASLHFIKNNTYLLFPFGIMAIAWTGGGGGAPYYD